MQQLPVAIENAKKLNTWNKEQKKWEHTVEFQPSTKVYKVIEDANLIPPESCDSPHQSV